jgi:hypothetical protein
MTASVAVTLWVVGVTSVTAVVKRCTPASMLVKV